MLWIGQGTGSMPNIEQIALLLVRKASFLLVGIFATAPFTSQLTHYR